MRKNRSVPRTMSEMPNLEKRVAKSNPLTRDLKNFDWDLASHKAHLFIAYVRFRQAKKCGNFPTAMPYTDRKIDFTSLLYIGLSVEEVCVFEILEKTFLDLKRQPFCRVSWLEFWVSPEYNLGEFFRNLLSNPLFRKAVGVRERKLEKESEDIRDFGFVPYSWDMFRRKYSSVAKSIPVDEIPSWFTEKYFQQTPANFACFDEESEGEFYDELGTSSPPMHSRPSSPKSVSARLDPKAEESAHSLADSVLPKSSEQPSSSEPLLSETVKSEVVSSRENLIGEKRTQSDSVPTDIAKGVQKIWETSNVGSDKLGIADELREGCRRDDAAKPSESGKQEQARPDPISLVVNQSDAADVETQKGADDLGAFEPKEFKSEQELLRFGADIAQERFRKALCCADQCAFRRKLKSESTSEESASARLNLHRKQDRRSKSWERRARSHRHHHHRKRSTKTTEVDEIVSILFSFGPERRILRRGTEDDNCACIFLKRIFGREIEIKSAIFGENLFFKNAVESGQKNFGEVEQLKDYQKLTITPEFDHSLDAEMILKLHVKSKKLKDEMPYRFCDAFVDDLMPNRCDFPEYFQHVRNSSCVQLKQERALQNLLLIPKLLRTLSKSDAFCFAFSRKSEGFSTRFFSGFSFERRKQKTYKTPNLTKPEILSFHPEVKTYPQDGRLSNWKEPMKVAHLHLNTDSVCVQQKGMLQAASRIALCLPIRPRVFSRRGCREQ